MSGPWLTAEQARAELKPREVDEAAQSIADSMGQVRLRETRVGPSDGARARRDMHAKHQGLLLARFAVASDLAAIGERLGVPLETGIFRAGRVYDCFLRFSSGSKYVRSDELPDGRGLGLKVLLPEGKSQDFVLLNGPAFFARDAAEMAVISQLEVQDLFDLSHLLRARNARGVRAALHMLGNQGISPLDLAYHSQTPYAHDEHVVKYRVRRVSPRTVVPVDAYRGDQRLFLALRDELHPTSNAARPPIVLEFAVQLARAHEESFPVDDATVVWDEHLSPFIPIATIVIEPQPFDTVRRMAAAEVLTFNPWNGLREHEPLGSINIARRRVYELGVGYRAKLNGAVAGDPAELYARLAQPSAGDDRAFPPGGSGPRGDAFRRSLQKLGGLASWLGPWLYRQALKPWAYLLPVGIVGFLLVWTFLHPEGPITIDLTKSLPSESLIPPAVWSKGYASPEQRKGLDQNPEYVFRYGATGSEYDAGMPYWIYRALPRIAPRYFEPTGGWASFGLDALDNADYYESYHGLPRGFVLSDTVVHILGSDVKATLKRVSFNCATCHRGEVEGQDGKPVFIDGMPNHVLNSVAFKQGVFGAFRDEAFNPENVIAKINEVIAEERQRSRLPGPSRLTTTEELVYRWLVGETKRRSANKPIDWISRRPPNGPGRVDAFGAIRFEFMARDPAVDHSVSTVDLPSIWNQGRPFRTTHHWDGNTTDVRGRNFGAILGVGGKPLSVHRRDVGLVGKWLDRELHAPEFPFARDEAEVAVALAVGKGKEVYEDNCAKCHGYYEQRQLLRDRRPECMDEPVGKADTDSARVNAMTVDFIDAFNGFGVETGLWGPEAFEARSGYLCPPLDGIWARAPYLHNGSVPTLHHLLLPPEERPRSFYRGSTRYDVEKGGFEWVEPSAGHRSFEFITQEQDSNMVGNSARGHNHPILDPDDRQHLIAYLLREL